MTQYDKRYEPMRICENMEGSQKWEGSPKPSTSLDRDPALKQHETAMFFVAMFFLESPHDFRNARCRSKKGRAMSNRRSSALTVSRILGKGSAV